MKNHDNGSRWIGPRTWLLLAAVLLVALPAVAEHKLTAEDWAKMKKGEIVREVKSEGGTQSGAWSAGLFNHPPALMWKVVCSLELYDDFVERTTVSVLLDENTKNKVVKAGQADAATVEKLFAGMKPGFRRQDPDGRWTVYSYQRNSLPWPVNDRWVLLEISHDDKNMKQTWKRLAGNIKQDYGTWTLSAAPEGKTLAVNEIHIDLDIPATGPFTAYAMDVSLPETYHAFEAMAQYFLKGGKGEKGAK